MNEEILQGLKNALERGFSIESATESFINAGYNPAEVREASGFISNKSEFTKLPTSSEPLNPEPKTAVPLTPSVSSDSSEHPPEKSQEASPKLKLILLIMLLLVVIGGAISLLLFKSEILDSFSSLLG